MPASRRAADAAQDKHPGSGQVPSEENKKHWLLLCTVTSARRRKEGGSPSGCSPGAKLRETSRGGSEHRPGVQAGPPNTRRPWREVGLSPAHEAGAQAAQRRNRYHRGWNERNLNCVGHATSCAQLSPVPRELLRDLPGHLPCNPQLVHPGGLPGFLSPTSLAGSLLTLSPHSPRLPSFQRPLKLLRGASLTAAESLPCVGPWLTTTPPRSVNMDLLTHVLLNNNGEFKFKVYSCLVFKSKTRV